MKDWVLVLYGTDRNPHFPMTTMAPTSSTSSPTTTTQKNSRQRKHKPSGYIDNVWQAKYYNINFENENDSNKFTYKKIPSRKKQRPRPPIRTTTTTQAPTTTKPRQKIKSRYEPHMCIFETLAKKNNMSTIQYYEMIKKDLSSGKDCVM